MKGTKFAVKDQSICGGKAINLRQRAETTKKIFYYENNSKPGQIKNLKKSKPGQINSSAQSSLSSTSSSGLVGKVLHGLEASKLSVQILAKSEEYFPTELLFHLKILQMRLSRIKNISCLTPALMTKWSRA